MDTSQKYDLFLNACKLGQRDVVEKLLPDVNVKKNDSAALMWAAGNGHIDVVKLLIPVDEPRAFGSRALRKAAGKGHFDVVKLLIPLSEPRDCNSEALMMAVVKKHWGVVDLLWDVSEPLKALRVMKETVFREEPLLFMERRLLAEKIKSSLVKNLKKTIKSKEFKLKTKM